jgi:DNA-directed RNA polymerase specialized sigma24 family protein
MPEKTVNRRVGRAGSCPISSERGDEAALFLEHERFLLRVTTRRLGGSQELAEDACAFPWLQLLRCQPDREAVVGWLRVVARNEGLRLLRISRREPSLEDKPAQRTDPASGEPLDWQELLPAREDTELAVEARGTAARPRRPALAPAHSPHPPAGGLQLQRDRRTAREDLHLR